MQLSTVDSFLSGSQNWKRVEKPQTQFDVVVVIIDIYSPPLWVGNKYNVSVCTMLQTNWQVVTPYHVHVFVWQLSFICAKGKQLNLRWILGFFRVNIILSCKSTDKTNNVYEFDRCKTKARSGDILFEQLPSFTITLSATVANLLHLYCSSIVIEQYWNSISFLIFAHLKKGVLPTVARVTEKQNRTKASTNWEC